MPLKSGNTLKIQYTKNYILVYVVIEFTPSY